MLKALDPGHRGPETRLLPVNGRLAFVVHDGADVSTLWATDGTPQGTVQLTDQPTSVSEGTRGPRYGPGAALAGTALVFTRRDALGNVSVWKTDGTAAGTVEVAALGAVGTVQPSSFIGVEGGFAYFCIAPAEPNQLELWRTDGTAAGTTLVWRRQTDAAAPYATGAVAAGGRPVFIVYDSEGSPRVWGEQGPVAPAQRVNRSEERLFPVGDQVYFFGRSGENTALFRTDGTDAGTHLVKMMMTNEGDLSTYVRATLGSLLLFYNDHYETPGLWRSDGTADGTYPLVTSRDPDRFYVGDVIGAGGLGFFGAQGGLWRTDGTKAGTFPVANLPNIRALTAVGERVYFASGAGDIWSSDGTSPGTGRVGVVPLAGRDGIGQAMKAFDDALYFAAEDGPHGNELRHFRPAAAPPPAPLAAPDLTVTMTGDTPQGRKGKPAKGVARLTLLNQGQTPAAPHEVRLVLSADGVFDGGDVTLATVRPGRKSTPAGVLRKLNVRYTIPAETPDGPYRVLAVTHAGNAITESDEANNVVAGPLFVHRRPYVDLRPHLRDEGGRLPRAGPATVRLIITNEGTATAKGPVKVTLSARAQSNLTTAPLIPFGEQMVKVSLRAGKGRLFTLSWAVPEAVRVGGYYVVLVTLQPQVDPPDQPENNNGDFREYQFV